MIKPSLFAAALHFMVLPGIVSAQCVAFDNPRDLFDRADLVFTGTVIANELTGATNSHLTPVAFGTLRVDQSWKGSPAQQVRVASDASFEIGKGYVVFAAGDRTSASIKCKWAELKEHAAAKLRYLERASVFRPLYEPIFQNEDSLRSALPYDSISLERSGGMLVSGDQFKLTLLRSGEVTLTTGGAIARRAGTFVGTTSLVQLGKINQLIDQARFGNFMSRYAANLSDLQTMTVTVSNGSTTQAVADYGGAGPVDLWSIQQALMAVAHDIAWKPREQFNAD